MCDTLRLGHRVGPPLPCPMTVWMLGSPFVLREERLGHFLSSGGPHVACGGVPHISWLSLALGTQFDVHKPVIFIF